MTHTINLMTRVQIVTVSLLVAMCMVSGAYAQTADTTSSTEDVVTSTEDVVEVEVEDEDVLLEDEALSEEIEEALSEEEEEVNDDLDGIEVDEPENVPGNAGLFWRSVRERVSLTFTFNKAKKIEKRIKFAEERMLLAEGIIANDPENAERVAKMEEMITKAQQYVEEAQERAQEMIADGDKRSARAIANIATHQVRKEAVLTRLETKFEKEGKDRFIEIRTSLATRNQRLVHALENDNLPD